MIQARITKACPARTGGPGFTLDIEFGTESGVTALFGPSGAGKTLVLDAIAGLIRPDKGRILIDDQIFFDQGSGTDLPAGERRCGYLFPTPALFPHMTLRQNLVFAAACRRTPRLERHRQVNEMLERLRLAGAAERLPAGVSKSERLRCSVGRALVGRPRLLLVDEPAETTSAAERSELWGLLREFRQELDIPVLLATRNLDECFEWGQQMLLIEAGRLLQSGPPRQVFDQPASVGAARLLGGYNLLPVTIEALDPGRKTSRMRLADAELAGPYFPGRFRGDRVTLCVRQDELLAAPAAGRPGPNQIRAALQRVAEGRHAVKLYFAGEIVVQTPRAAFQEKQHVRDWVVEFPEDRLRVL